MFILKVYFCCRKKLFNNKIMIKKFDVFFCLTLATALFFSFGCGSPTDKKDDITAYYHLDKKYWDENDYDDVINKIKNSATVDQKIISLSDAEKAPVFKKLVDKENIAIVADDTTLGLQHRETFVNAIVNKCETITDMYSGLNREDKYNYPSEYILAWKFYLWAEYYNVKIINEKMKKESDATNASEANELCISNMNIVINNYNIYLDLANRESSFTADALKFFAEGIDECFPKIISDFPDGDYSRMLPKVNALLQKVSSVYVKKSLENLKTKIDSFLEQKRTAATKK